MDKNKIIQIIMSNPNMAMEELKKNALASGINENDFMDAWNEAKNQNNNTATLNTGLKQKSVLLLFFINLITMGLYTPIWFSKQQNALNNLNSKLKLSEVIIATILIFQFVELVWIFIVPLVLMNERFSFFLGGLTKLDPYQPIIALLLAGLLLKVTFDIRSMLMSHFKTELSWLGTFFFGILYLQYEINNLTKTKNISNNNADMIATTML